MELSEKSITLKVVYYGPAQSGKTTNLVSLHNSLKPELKSDIMILDTKDDRTLFFDLLPIGFVAPSGILIKLKIYTVPGQVVHDASRKAILMNADGVVFVADSQLDQNRNNAESFKNLENNLGLVGLDIEKLPMVVQFNKRDLENIISEEAINGRWEQAPWPLHFTSALKNTGVRETLLSLLLKLYPYVDNVLQLDAKHGVSKKMFLEKIFKGIK